MFSAFTILWFAAPAFAQCTPATSEKTIWGGNMHPVLKEKKLPRDIHGIVRAADHIALQEVLVEIYDHPELAPRSADSEERQTRVAACMTDAQGRFAFTLSPGHYEVRFSKSSEWDVLSIPVVVQKFAPFSKKNLAVEMRLGT